MIHLLLPLQTKGLFLFHFILKSSSSVSHLTPSSRSSPDQQWDTADVFRLWGERRRDRRLGLGQGNPDVGSSQGPAVVGPVPAHAYSIAAGKFIMKHTLWRTVSTFLSKFKLASSERHKKKYFQPQHKSIPIDILQQCNNYTKNFFHFNRIFPFYYSYFIVRVQRKTWTYFSFCSSFTSWVFWSGAMRANTVAFINTCKSVRPCPPWINEFYYRESFLHTL